jgi:hypothetical protein
MSQQIPSKKVFNQIFESMFIYIFLTFCYFVVTLNFISFNKNVPPKFLWVYLLCIVSMLSVTIILSVHHTLTDMYLRRDRRRIQKNETM